MTSIFHREPARSLRAALKQGHNAAARKDMTVASFRAEACSTSAGPFALLFFQEFGQRKLVDDVFLCEPPFAGDATAQAQVLERAI